MGYDIYLTCPHCNSVCQMEEPFEDGGTYCVGGTTDCHLSITFNYAKLYAAVFPPYEDSVNGSLRWIYGKTGAETIPTLKTAIEALGTVRDSDYWKPTPGNAGAMLKRLLSFAEAHPEAIFSGD